MGLLLLLSSFSRVRLLAVPWTTACQAPLSSTISPNLLKFMSIELVTLSKHLILCCPLLLLPSIFPCGSVGKESTYNAGDMCSIPGLERSPGEGNGNALQYSCLENPMNTGAWRATVHRVAKIQI